MAAGQPPSLTYLNDINYPYGFAMPQIITLRPLEENDIDQEYVSWYENTDGHLDYFTGSGRVFTKATIIKDFKDGLKTKRWFYFLIINEFNQKIGNVKIGPIDLNNKTSDLVCLIGNRNFTGKGIAKLAIRAANQFAFEKLDIRRLQSGMYESNVRSIKAYTSSDWFIEAVMKGYYLANGRPEDRVCVACLNPKYFPGGDENDLKQ